MPIQREFCPHRAVRRLIEFEAEASGPARPMVLGKGLCSIGGGDVVSGDRTPVSRAAQRFVLPAIPGTPSAHATPALTPLRWAFDGSSFVRLISRSPISPSAVAVIEAHELLAEPNWRVRTDRSSGLVV